MPASPPRVTAAYLQPLLETAAAHGVSPSALATGAGLAPTALDPLPDALAAGDYIALLDAGSRLAHDPHFGLHVGERVRPGTYSVYGLVLLACRDIGQALEQTQRYEQLAHDLGRSRLEPEGALARYTWVSHYPLASRHLAESVFAGIRTFGCWLAGRPLAPQALAFAHARPKGVDPAEYVRVLGTVPDFDAPAHTAAFDASLLALPLPAADTGMYPLLQQHAERLLRERAQASSGIVAQVHAAIVRSLATEPVRLAGVAAALDLSPRTLQRKLADAGATFQQVLDAARYALAMDYLRQDALSLVDIAFLLGFQEQSAFTHAFREWSGLNPGAWRERALAGGR
ncbi:AraC family transcriptional regulator [Massilia putida]|uniref:AraC family transcriptional regulator n=1 Tax=Massilia putida TaxID=1141883 RepID=UPI000B33FB86|nr:AraC family transcriptional regulator [Massilia putida]